MTNGRVLIAGIGNIFFGDDAFGVEVAQRLARRPWPDGVRVVDFGIRGFDLALALLGGTETAILVDAVPRGEAPGTLYVIEPGLDASEAGAGPATIEPHSLDPVKVLRLVQALGGRTGRLLIVGCEPATLGDDARGQMGLSAPVAAAVEEAAGLIESLVVEILGAGGGARDEADEARHNVAR